jgi:hypothetical protein
LGFFFFSRSVLDPEIPWEPATFWSITKGTAMKRKFLTKPQAIALFKQTHGDLLKKETKTTIRCVWNDFTDSLHRSGEISDSQVQNWVQPSFCK